MLDSQHQVYLDEPAAEEEKFDHQGLLVGTVGKTKFWELYKSERKFKDQDGGTNVDPRYVYF